MRASAKRMLSFLLSLVMLAGAIMVYALLIIPAYEEIQRSRSIIVTKTNGFEELDRVMKRVSDLLTQYQGSGNVQETISLSLPNEPLVSQAVGSVQSLAFLSNLQMLSIKAEILPFQGEPGAPAFIRQRGAVKIEAQVRGSYADFEKFISGLETNVRILDVKQFGVKGEVKDGQFTNSHAFDVVVLAYYQDAAGARKVQ